jgi:SAM-dependent methyltransferase
MSEKASRYLKIYANISRTRRGLIAPFANAFRDRLDHKARSLGQADRFGFFLPRAAELCGLTIGKSFTAMDLGAGDGWAMRCNLPDLRRIAVDAAPNFATSLAHQGIEFHAADLSRDRLPADDDSVDLIMMNHVIEHIADPSHVMQECARVLRPGGGLYLRTPNVQRVGQRFWDDYTHVKPYTVRSLPAMADAFGFSLRKILESDHARICLDMLTDGRFRRLLFIGGREIEAAFSLRCCKSTTGTADFSLT